MARIELWEQLQNTPQLIYMSLNKNSVYCVMPRSSKLPTHVSEAEMSCRVFWSLAELCHLPFICKGSNVKIYAFIVIRRYLCISLLDLLDKKNYEPWTMLKVLSISSTCSLYHILLDECSKTKFFNWFSFQMIQVYLLKNFSFLFQLETIA